MNIPNRYSHPGFTLVELLVVIVIIIALGMLSMMGFRRIRDAGDRGASMGNLRQLQLANVAYAADNNGQYVPVETYDGDAVKNVEWHNNATFISYLTGDDGPLQRGRKTNNQVPLNMLDPVAVRAKGRMWDRIWASDSYNVQGMPGKAANGQKAFRVIQITNPSRSMCIVTGTDYQTTYTKRYLWFDDDTEGKSTNQKMAYRHGGKALVVYYDGSADSMSWAEMKAIDDQDGANHPFWKADAN